MTLYISIIGIAIILMFSISVLANITAYSVIATLVLILGAVVAVIAVDGLFAYLVHKMPESWFSIDKKFYSVSNGERKFYEKIQIKKWKDKILELGGLGGFSKKNIQSNPDKEYFKRFLIESNKGVVTHIIGAFAGFSIILLFPQNCILYITLPVSIINFFMNLPSLFILRYNTPKLLVCYKRMARTEKQTTAKAISTTEENVLASEENN